jgi:hypothetical protein
MDAYAVGADQALRVLGVVKTARFIGKDFAAGVDPTGTFTTAYGIEDAAAEGAAPWLRGATGVTGGLLGGGLAVPSVIYGLVNTPSGYAKGKLPGAAKAFWRGVKYPMQSIVRGAKGARALKRAPVKGLTAKEVKMFSALAEESNLPHYLKFLPGSGKVPSGVMSKAMKNQLKRYSTKGLTPQEYKKIPRGVREVAQDRLRSDLGSAVSQIGLASSIAGGSAGLQYAKGREMGSFMSTEKRKEFAES